MHSRFLFPFDLASLSCLILLTLTNGVDFGRDLVTIIICGLLDRIPEERREGMDMDSKTMRTGAAEEPHYESSNGVQLLPQEIIMDILSRLPIHFLLQCTLVSKAWRNIIVRNPIFASMQHNQALENRHKSHGLMFCLENPSKSPNLYLVERGGAPHGKLTVMYAQLTCLECWFDVIGSCNGLLCFSYYDNGVGGYCKSNRACVSNPITGECVILPSEDSKCAWISGFGFDSTRKEYKVVRVVHNRDAVLSTAEIHTLGSNSWRRIEDDPHSRTKYMRSQSDVLVNGRLHWCSFPNKPIFIFSLDMGHEQFEEVPVVTGLGSRGFIYLVDWKGCLAIVEVELMLKDDDALHIWVMKEYNVKESWTRQANVRWRPTWLYGSTGYAPFYDEGVIHDLQVTDHPRFRGRNRYRVIAHVGSLISLKTLMGKEV
eukprot:TRINITY_DN24311_c0_g1_i3.p1 TRINITY_DN24311_c0_g1~~TRINITY_DN24311_c0_g1_i3.p1  ORF type:complete len:429 (-),score=43.12 TRINITY_DN24311_c0_g1_i3:147-1433(-)